MWEVITTDTFDEWFDNLKDTDRTNVIAGMLLLQEKGPHLSRPYADTVNDSDYVYPSHLEMLVSGNQSDS